MSVGEGLKPVLAAGDLLAVVDSLRDGLVIVGKDLRILYANPAAARLVQPASGLIGRRVRDWGLLDREDDVWRGVEVVVAGGRFPASEREVGGVSVSIEVTPAPCGAVLLLRDTTRAQQAARLRDALISTVSHELRTPLASIKGYATTLLRKDVAWDETSRREFLEIIDEESDRLRELIDSLLDMSRLEAGVLHLERLPVQIARIARRAANSLRPATERPRIVMSFDRDFPLVDCDPKRIEQVFRNLLENAVKYSASSGEINVKGQIIRDPQQLPHELPLPACPLVVISVTDTGPGIAKHELDRLFAPFHRAGNVDARISGSGLGLSICRGIIEAHGGHIWAQSEAGQGTTMSFALPLC
jgi:signal transduction histidine kinase